MTSIEEVKARASVITATCKLIQDHVSKGILVSPHQVSAILGVVIMDANKIVDLVDKIENSKEEEEETVK